VSKVIVDMGMSLDGFIAGPNAGPGNPLGDGGMRIHQWTFDVEAWRERQSLRGGKTNRDHEVVEEANARVEAFVMGRRMFDEGEVGWPDPPPFRAPVFVLTKDAREPWVRQGGTTFTFVTDGIERAIEQARAAAGGKDVRIAGGANAVKPGSGNRAARRDTDTPRTRAARRWGSVVRRDRSERHPTGEIAGYRFPRVTHLKYRVVKKD
jgi:dihydrofolate reductase